MASRFLARRSRNKLLALRDAPPMVTFTFDDVPASACEAGAHILEERGGRGTFYVAAGNRSAPDAGSTPASIEQLRTIWRKGHEIGCHTYSHPAVRYMSFDEIGTELARNQSALKEIDSSITVRNFAYPYGDHSIRLKRYFESRFDSCRSGHAGINRRYADLGALAAWPLQNAIVDRARIADLIAETAQTGGWLIFFSHDVATRPSKYGVTPDLLSWAVDAAKSAGCALLSTADSLKLIHDRAQRQ